MARPERKESGAPLWVLAVLWFMTGLTLAFSILGYWRPTLLFGTGAFALTGPIGFYLARNVAMICGGLYALTIRSVAMVRLMLVMRIVSESLDGIHYIVGHGPIGPTVVPLILAAIEVAALLRIRTLAD